MTIIIEKVGTPQGDRIHLRFPYSQDNVTKAKRVPGASFSKNGGPHWSYPLDMSVCRMLREQFGSDLKVGPELTHWAWQETQHETHMTTLRNAADADLVRVPEHAPVLANAMSSRTYQRVGARFIADGRSVLIADQPGLGKTLETLAGLVEARVDGPVLVVSLKTATRIVWETEIKRWLPGVPVTVATGTGAQKNAAIAEFWKSLRMGQMSVLIINPEALRSKRTEGVKEIARTHPGLFENPWAAVVVDESAHNQSSLIAPSGNKNKWTQFRTGVSTLPLTTGAIKVALSGTPMRGRPEKLWGTLNWLHPTVFTSYWKWLDRYFILEENDFTGNRTEIRGLRDPEAFARDHAKYILRRTKAEVAKDLPPKQYAGTPLDPADPHSPVAVWLPLDPKQQKAYDAMAKDASAALDGGSLMANGVLAELTRLKQFANSGGYMENGEFVPSLPSNKFDWLVGMLADRGITGNKDDDEGDSQVVVASQFTSVINVYARELRALGIECAVLTGATKEADRLAQQQAFQSGKGPRVFLLNTNAGGVAITLDAADDLVVLDETWVPDDQEQVEDRIHRVSRIHQVTIWNVRSLGTVEEGIARLNLSADNLQKTLLDGSRGVNVARQILRSA